MRRLIGAALAAIAIAWAGTASAATLLTFENGAGTLESGAWLEDAMRVTGASQTPVVGGTAQSLGSLFFDYTGSRKYGYIYSFDIDIDAPVVLHTNLFFHTITPDAQAGFQRVEFTPESYGSMWGLGGFWFESKSGQPVAIRVDNLTFTTVPGSVPEPATWAMMIAGFGLAGTALRRRRAVLAYA